MRTEKSKGKRMTLLDWALLGGVLSALLIGVLLFLYGGGGESGAQVRYTVYVPEIRTSFLEEAGGVEMLIPVGAAVRSENGTALLGSVQEVLVNGHVRPVVREGTVVFEEDTTRQDLYITVLGEAREREGDGLRISDIRIAAGESGTFRFGSFYASGGSILSVRWGEE